MDAKTLTVLEYPKVLARLAAHCAFSASAELARQLEPTSTFELAVARLQETSEARHLLATHDLSIGGSRDVRPQVDLAARGGVLDPPDLLDVKNTLIATRELRKSLEKRGEECPRLAELALSLPAPQGVVDAISRAVSDKGEVLDSASPRLATIRSELRVTHDRLMSRLQKYVTDANTVSMLQEALITQRDGRYVIPLRAEFKGRIKAIVHDQSSSGATLFVEPLAVVEINNEYRELQLAERDEVRRVLAELSQLVGAAAGEIVPGIEALAEIDLAFAKAKYAEQIEASEPVLHPLAAKTGDESRTVVRLLYARHPLLDPATVVAIDFDPAPETRAVVITGPNTGGKTVTLKTVGLLALMAQSGLHIPAQSGSELSVFAAVYADIGDEQSIEQSLSTFSGHITNIIRLLKKADSRSLVILDELGAGTDPQEGAALARAILTHLLSRNITTLVTTHHPELKAYAHMTPGVVNASVEFDLATLRPTFHLTIGLPGRSNALAIAKRLGLPEEIISAARSEIDPANLRADDLLDEINRQRKLAHKERQKAEKARSEAHRMRRELAQRLEKIEDERLDVLDRARAEAEVQAGSLQAEVQELKRELQKARQPLEALKPLLERVEAVEEKVQKPVTRRASRGPALQGPPRLGEKVLVRTIKAEGVVTSLGTEDAEVQIGALRVRARLSDLQRRSAGEAEPEQDPKPAGRKRRSQEAAGDPPASTFALEQASPGMELDLRGQTADDALDMLDNYLDRAYLSGMPFVRIIHGKGTGKLRQAVRDMLKDHAHVLSFEEGHAKEGGSGVTVAKIAA